MVSEQISFKNKKDRIQYTMPNIKSKLSHYQQKQLQEVMYLNTQAKAFRDRSKSVALRKEILDKQKQRTYSSENDRIRSHIESSATPSLTKDRLKTRTEHLKQVGARALDTIV